MKSRSTEVTRGVRKMKQAELVRAIHGVKKRSISNKEKQCSDGVSARLVSGHFVRSA